MSRSYSVSDLPVHHRAIAFDPEAWNATKVAAKQRKVTVQTFMTEAVDAELAPLMESLAAASAGKNRKFVRVPVEDHALGLIGLGKRKTGIPAVALLRLCMSRYAARCPAAPAAPVRSSR